MSECTGKIVFLAKQARTTEGNYNPSLNGHVLLTLYNYLLILPMYFFYLSKNS